MNNKRNFRENHKKLPRTKIEPEPPWIERTLSVVDNKKRKG